MATRRAKTFVGIAKAAISITGRRVGRGNEEDAKIALAARIVRPVGIISTREENATTKMRIKKAVGSRMTTISCSAKAPEGTTSADASKVLSRMA